MSAAPPPVWPPLEPPEDDYRDPRAAPHLDPVGLVCWLRRGSFWWRWRCPCLTTIAGTQRAAVVALVAAHRLSCDVLPAPPRARTAI
jgi:hypothetical protein